MQRYFLNNNFKFDENDQKHLKNVMRFKDGDLVEVCYEDKCFTAKLIFNNNLFSYEVIKELNKPNHPYIRIIHGMPKGNKIDFITKSISIFGASELIFIEMDRSIAKISNESFKVARLNKIAKEASELAKRFNIPKISFIKDFKSLNLNGNTYFLDELEISNHFNQIKYDYSHIINVIIGPEGGISNKERTLFIDKQFIPLSLGKYIMPTELAHIPFLSHFLPK